MAETRWKRPGHHGSEMQKKDTLCTVPRVPASGRSRGRHKTLLARGKSIKIQYPQDPCIV